MAAGDKKNKNLPYVAALVLLCIGFVLSRYVFFSLHGMKQWPLILFVASLCVGLLSYRAKAPGVALSTGMGYLLGFVVGAVFQSQGTDPGGGSTSNFWLLWTGVLLAFVVGAILITEVRKKRHRRG
jgi:protein-S-isoprenylcysteine O-methyltransferase Ste14